MGASGHTRDNGCARGRKSSQGTSHSTSLVAHAGKPRSSLSSATLTVARSEIPNKKCFGLAPLLHPRNIAERSSLFLVFFLAAQKELMVT